MRAPGLTSFCLSRPVRCSLIRSSRDLSSSASISAVERVQVPIGKFLGLGCRRGALKGYMTRQGRARRQEWAAGAAGSKKSLPPRVRWRRASFDS